jgi:hypothetical protein
MPALRTALLVALLLAAGLAPALPARAQGPWRHADPRLGLAFELDPARLPVGGQANAVVLTPEALRDLGIPDVRPHDQARLTSLGQGRFWLDAGGRRILLDPGRTPGFPGIAAEPFEGFRPAPGRPATPKLP